MNPIVDLPEPLLLGLHALVIVARKPECNFSAKHIAEELGASEGHLSKVLQKLVRGGYLESVHGPGGGYRLVKSPDDVNMLEVVEFLGGPFELDGCGFGGCRNKPCLIGGLVDELTAAIIRFLKPRTLGLLLRHFDLAPKVRINMSLSSPDDAEN